MDLFDQDRADYPDGLPHLPTPNDDECLEPESMRWFGWARKTSARSFTNFAEGYEAIRRRRACTEMLR